MKKLTVSTILLANLAAASTGYTKPLSCGYKDHFHLGKTSPVSLHITKIASDNNVTVKQLDATQFDVNDAANCPPEGGTEYVTYSIDPTHYCKLTIKDSELKNDPDITVNCKGMDYNGWTYDGFLSYSYTLNFSQ